MAIIIATCACNFQPGLVDTTDDPPANLTQQSPPCSANSESEISFFKSVVQQYLEDGFSRFEIIGLVDPLSDFFDCWLKLTDEIIETMPIIEEEVDHPIQVNEPIVAELKIRSSTTFQAISDLESGNFSNGIGKASGRRIDEIQSNAANNGTLQSGPTIAAINFVGDLANRIGKRLRDDIYQANQQLRDYSSIDLELALLGDMSIDKNHIDEQYCNAVTVTMMNYISGLLQLDAGANEIKVAGITACTSDNDRTIEYQSSCINCWTIAFDSINP